MYITKNQSRMGRFLPCRSTSGPGDESLPQDLLPGLNSCPKFTVREHRTLVLKVNTDIPIPSNHEILEVFILRENVFYVSWNACGPYFLQFQELASCWDLSCTRNDPVAR